MREGSLGHPAVHHRPLDFLRSSEDPDARKVLTAYLSVPKSYRRLLPPEAFCQAAAVPPQRVLELVTVAGIQLGVLGSTIVAASLQPYVVGQEWHACDIFRVYSEMLVGQLPLVVGLTVTPADFEPDGARFVAPHGRPPTDRRSNRSHNSRPAAMSN
jgi:hypothetical protein